MSSSPKPPKQPTGPFSAPKLLNRVRQVMRLKQYSYRTWRVDADWIRCFILFHGKRHPPEMGAQAIESFLSHPAVHEHVAAITPLVIAAAPLPRRRAAAFPARLPHDHRRRMYCWQQPPFRRRRRCE